ncbi:DNA mismatch repair endonuclease MutH [Pseudoalteromonas aurantia]|nr:DNA mismatch repair endonuclease MutH [Pseudoalteromonas aurantia]
MQRSSPPATINELMQRVNDIAGITLGELAAQYQFKTPEHLLKEKGWPGQLLEYVLGASAGSKPVPDFELLGIELKSLPIGYNGKPLETTYVTTVPLTGLTGATFHDSNVKKKLAHVLWLPVLAERALQPIDRIIGSGFLWQPNTDQINQLQRDWEEQIELIALGKIEQISGHLGEVMQIRPKAANSKALTDVIGPHGKLTKTLPRGFYLKTKFTQQILTEHFQG